MAKYPYIVNRDGIWYPAGAEVPAGTFLPSGETEAKENKAYTKTEINRMPISELKALASRTGVEDYDSMTGAELKKYLIEVFGL